MKSRQGQLTRVNILLPDEMYRDFKARCEYAGIGMATFVRRIIEREIETPTETKNPRPDPVVSALQHNYIEARDSEIMGRLLNGERPTDLARAYGMTPSGISKVVKRARERG